MAIQAATVGDGRAVVTTAGTRVKLNSGAADTASGPVRSVAITAMQANTGVVVVGGPAVVAAVGTRRGVPLSAGDTMSLDTDDLLDVWLDSTVNGEGVTFAFTT